MTSGDTSLGGEGRVFPETTMGFVGGLAALEGPAYARALESLCLRYWKPAYSYLRIGWAKSNEEAKDLTQAFFVWLIEDPALRRYDASKGGFRVYLRVLLRHFAGRADRDTRRLKRGGDARVFSLEGDAPALPELLGDPSKADPERVFDRVWFEELVRAATQSVRERCRRENLEARFETWEAETLGTEGGLQGPERAKALWWVREELRRELRGALAEAAGGDQELEDDWNRLLGI